MLTASIQKLTSSIGTRWVCRLFEPGGYVWHGQVAETCFSNITEQEFKDRCVTKFGELKFN